MTASTKPARGADCSPRQQVTKSLLGYGVLAGPFYVVASVVQGLLRSDFDFAHDSWSLLSLGSWGWVHVVVFVLSGLMTIAAAVGFRRHLAGSPGGSAWAWLAGYGVSLIAAGAFKPDRTGGSVTAHGVLHLAAGGLGFVAFAVSWFLLARRFRAQAQPVPRTLSRAAGVLLLVGFVAIAAAGTGAFGVVLLTLAVVCAWAWLTAVSLRFYAEAAEIGRTEARQQLG